ncbi:hypothetical protein AHIS2_p037 [Acaryochloris phage A-HIS2]|nr:hypothetical protein AHIS2_p037 [Acaryochloris phage A-HIS2]
MPNLVTIGKLRSNINDLSSFNTGCLNFYEHWQSAINNIMLNEEVLEGMAESSVLFDQFNMGRLSLNYIVFGDPSLPEDCGDPGQFGYYLTYLEDEDLKVLLNQAIVEIPKVIREMRKQKVNLEKLYTKATCRNLVKIGNTHEDPVIRALAILVICFFEVEKLKEFGKLTVARAFVAYSCAMARLCDHDSYLWREAQEIAKNVGVWSMLGNRELHSVHLDRNLDKSNYVSLRDCLKQGYVRPRLR